MVMLRSATINNRRTFYADLVRHVSHAQAWASLAQSDADPRFVDAKCVEFMGRYPEIRDWALE
jgi:hypothetical protein